MWFQNVITKIVAFFSAIIALITGGSINPNPGTGVVQYTVSFVNYDNKTVISSQKVNSGENAAAPTNPTKTGASFLGWSGNYINVTKDEKVKAIFDDEKNVFIIAQSTGKKGDTVKVKLSLKGKVTTCGYDIKISYDSNLKLVSYDDDLDMNIVLNPKASTNSILLNYSGAINTTKKKDIVELSFKIKDSDKTALPIIINVNSMKEVAGNSVVNSAYNIVNGIVFVV